MTNFSIEELDRSGDLKIVTGLNVVEGDLQP